MGRKKNELAKEGKLKEDSKPNHLEKHAEVNKVDSNDRGKVSDLSGLPSTSSSSTTSKHSLDKPKAGLTSIKIHPNLEASCSRNNRMKDEFDEFLEDLRAIGPVFRNIPRLPKGKTVDYKEVREPANRLWAMRSSWLKKAEEEKRIGTAKKAKEYFDMARIVEQSARRADLLASTQLFDFYNRNDNSETVLDFLEFHIDCQHKDEAITICQYNIWFAINSRTFDKLRVVIGKGTSDASVDSLQNAVTKFLSNNGVIWEVKKTRSD